MYNYKSTGVDNYRADEIIKKISSDELKSNFSNFAGVLESDIFKEFKIVACCDGIGTKILPLIEKNDAGTIANDLVAMNLNDLITLGAKPLFFLDYIATNSLNSAIIEQTIENLVKILKKYNCALLGGEISQMRDLISPNAFDVAGFMVGYYGEDDFLDKYSIQKNDVVVGFKSCGIHSNGFGLIRKLRADNKISEEIFNETLKPTKIYFDLIQKLNSKKIIKSAAHITGGGIYSNIKRAIKPELELKLNYSSIPKQEIFEILKKFISIDECFNVFNMGCGFAVICDKNCVCEVLEVGFDYEPFVLGEIS